MNKRSMLGEDAVTHLVVDPHYRAAIVDALYRFGVGQDLRDRTLFESALSSQATLDIAGPARRLGVELQ